MTTKLKSTAKTSRNFKALDRLFTKFQKWIDENNNKAHHKQIEYSGYMPPDEDFNIIRRGQKKLVDEYIAYPVQQGEKELKQLVQYLLNHIGLDKALEIGLGRLGGTHVLFSLLFNQVCSVESNSCRTTEVWEKNLNTGWLKERSSYIINGDSRDKTTINEVYDTYGPHTFDFIYMDSAHDYMTLKKDYLNYKDLLKEGGVIAWHDILHRRYAVFEFLFDLRVGKIDGKYHNVYDICYSDTMGIGLIHL